MCVHWNRERNVHTENQVLFYFILIGRRAGETPWLYTPPNFINTHTHTHPLSRQAPNKEKKPTENNKQSRVQIKSDLARGCSR